MEKYESFAAAIQTLFDINIETVEEEIILGEAKKLLAQGSKFEAFLVAISRYRIDHTIPQGEFLLVIEQSANCKIDQSIFIEVKKVFSNRLDGLELYSQMLRNDRIVFDEYQALIALCTIGLTHRLTVLGLLLSRLRVDNLTNERVEFINKIINFYASLRKGELLWGALYEICEHQIKNNLVSSKTVSHVSQTIIACNSQNMLLCFYWYYAYLGQKKISELFFSFLPEKLLANADFQMPFGKEGFIWSGFTFEILRKKYDGIVDILHGQTSIGNRRSISALLEKNKLAFLVPLCLYARDTGNIEAESFILWYVIRLTNSQQLIQRMAEISGYEAPREFRSVPVDARGKWLTNHLAKCVYAVGSMNPVTEIDTVKTVFTVRPFELKVIKPLLKINGIHTDAVVENMLQYSISRMTPLPILKRLFFSAIAFKSRFGLRQIINRIILLGHSKILLPYLEKLESQLKPYEFEQHLLVGETLISYKEFIVHDAIDMHRFNQLNKKCAANNKKLNAFADSFEKAELVTQKRILDMMYQKKYEEISKELKRGNITSSITLGIILKSALTERNSSHVLLAYTKLVEVDSAFASLYTLEVEPYFLSQNISKETRKIGMNNLVSQVWGRPAVLEYPVDRQALRVANYAKEASGGPRKKRLRF